MVAIRKGTDAQIDPRKVDAIKRSQLAAHQHLAVDRFALHFLDLQLNESIIDVDRVTGFDNFW